MTDRSRVSMWLLASCINPCLAIFWLAMLPTCPALKNFSTASRTQALHHVYLHMLQLVVI